MVERDGDTLEIASADGRVRAGIDLLGGGLRFLRVGGRALVEEYPAGARRPAAAGAVMFPWPNRVRDGRWRSGLTAHQLEVSEPGRGTANHGLVSGRQFALVHSGGDAVTVRTRVRDEPGYPFDLRLEITYSAREDGLVVSTSVVNEGSEPAPCALGFHPYLRVAGHDLDDLRVHLAVDRAVQVDDRLLPVAVEPLAPGSVDPSDLPLARRELNHCFRSVPGPDGGHSHRVVGPDGGGVEIRADASFGWVQVFTCPDFPRGPATVRALALEPMTAPPDALNSGIDLRWLEPGAEWALRWSLHAIEPSAAVLI